MIVEMGVFHVQLLAEDGRPLIQREGVLAVDEETAGDVLRELDTRVYKDATSVAVRTGTKEVEVPDEVRTVIQSGQMDLF